MRLSDRSFEPVKIVGGASTRAVIQRASDKDQPGVEFAYPRLLARVKRNSILRAGMVLELADGHYVAAGHSGTLDYRSFHLFRCDRQVTWTRPVTRTDPVTKLEIKDGDPEPLGSIWVMWQRNRREFMDLQIRFAQETYLTAAGADVQLDDFLDGLKVKRSNKALGLTVMELQA